MTELPATAHSRWRWLPISLLLIAMIGVGFFLFGTQTGRDWRERKVITHWAEAHPLAAPAGIVAAYVVSSILALPVWWLQLLAGRLLGLFEGVVICQTAATLGAAASGAIAQFSLADWLHGPASGKLTRLRSLQHKLGHNGFLVVVLTRLLHVAPFGMSNYLFALLGIPLPSIVIGTAIGNIPAVTVYVALGRPERLSGSPVIWFVVVLNVLILAIAITRYLRPRWFAALHVE